MGDWNVLAAYPVRICTFIKSLSELRPPAAPEVAPFGSGYLLGDPGQIYPLYVSTPSTHTTLRTAVPLWKGATRNLYPCIASPRSEGQKPRFGGSRETGPKPRFAPGCPPPRSHRSFHPAQAAALSRSFQSSSSFQFQDDGTPASPDCFFGCRDGPKLRCEDERDGKLTPGAARKR